MMKSTFTLACSLVLGGAVALSVASCDKDELKPTTPETPRAHLDKDGKWVLPAAAADALLADATVTRVDNDYFNGKLPVDSSSVIGGFVTPSGLEVAASTAGDETRLACTVAGASLSLADVTPQDSTFYTVAAGYGWKKGKKYEGFAHPKSAVLRGVSAVQVNGLDASGAAHDLSAQTWLITTTAQNLTESGKGTDNRFPLRLSIPFISSAGYKWLDARFTLVIPTAALGNYPQVKVTLLHGNGKKVEHVWKRG